MGRPKKVIVGETEAESAVKKPALKTVEAVHTIKYSEPVTVPVAEPEPDDTEGLVVDDVELDDDAEPKARPLSPRARLREKLAKLGVTNQALKLRIDRLPNYDVNGQSGINAEKDYIRTTACTEAFFDSDDYLEHIRSIAGPGTYWLTLRGGKSIVAQWQERIGGAPAIAPLENPAGEIYQPTPTVDPFASLLKQAKQFAELRKLFAPESDNAQPRQILSSDTPTTEQALLTLMNADNAVVDAVASKLKGLFRGNSGSSNDSEKSWMDVLYMAVERDTLPKLINQFATQFKPGAVNANPQPAQPAPVEPQPSPDVIAYQRLISVLVNCARVNGDVTPALQAIDGFVALFPEHAGAVDGFLNAPVEMALPAIAQSSPMAAEVVAMPHAAEWFGKLKTAYFDNEEGEEHKE